MRSLSAKPDGSGFSPAMNWNARKVFASREISNISSPRVGCCAFCSAAMLGAIQSNCASATERSESHFLNHAARRIRSNSTCHTRDRELCWLSHAGGRWESISSKSGTIWILKLLRGVFFRRQSRKSSPPWSHQKCAKGFFVAGLAKKRTSRPPGPDSLCLCASSTYLSGQERRMRSLQRVPILARRNFGHSAKLLPEKDM